MGQFLYVYRQTEASRQATNSSPEASQQNMQRWMTWLADLEAKGHLKDRGQPLEPGGKVVRADKAITDGPYTEAKDLVGGFTIVEAADLDHAVELAHGCPIFARGGSVEVRPVMRF